MDSILFFFFLFQHNRQESISPEYHRYASIGKLPKASSSSLAAAANNNNKYSQTGNTITALGTTTTAPGKAGLKQHTVTADIHNNNGISHGHNNGTSSSSSITSSKIGHSNAAHNNAVSTNNNGHQYNVANVAATSAHQYNYSEIHASAFATPPTRRRFFNHKNLRNALTGVSGVVASHRRTASNGGGCPIDSASILSEGMVQMFFCFFFSSSSILFFFFLNTLSRMVIINGSFHTHSIDSAIHTYVCKQVFNHFSQKTRN